MSLSDGISKFRNKVMGNGGSYDEFVQKLAIDCFSGIILANPVQKEGGGFSRANWRVKIGSAATGTVAEKDTTGQPTISKMENEVESWSWKDGAIFFSNSAPYINRLEYDSWSNQAPNGMVRINIERVKAKYL